MKFCKDCKHVSRDPAGVMHQYPDCYSPRRPRDLVTGNVEYVPASMARCLAMRPNNLLPFDLCGVNGDWFEPINPSTSDQ